MTWWVWLLLGIPVGAFIAYLILVLSLYGIWNRW